MVLPLQSLPESFIRFAEDFPALPHNHSMHNTRNASGGAYPHPETVPAPGKEIIK
jgi:hypothetical protein